MSKAIGDVFKMEPITRKAENAVYRTSRNLGIAPDELEWTRIQAAPAAVDRGIVMLVVAVGDEHWDTVRWVQQQNDPDWKIV